jgi:hypothetical protein
MPPRETAATYILVEAVNIYANVFDTSQLSVIRGGSYLLAKAIQDIADGCVGRLEPLSVGASSGLFRVKDPETAGEIEGLLRRFLDQHETFGLFTFCIEFCTCDNLREAKEILKAKVRFRQLRQLTKVPDRAEWAKCNAEGIRLVPCGREGKRAAIPGPQGSNPEETLSTSVARRRTAGRGLRAGIYFDLLGADRGAKPRQQEPCDGLNVAAQAVPSEELCHRLDRTGFTEELETLARCDGFRALNHKVAVIYLDGNGFGRIQRTHVKNPIQQIQFDACIGRQRRAWLATLLKSLLNGTYERVRLTETKASETKGDILRLETLLWGGDEMTLVVPAWLGLDVLQLFYAVSADWRFATEKLTHAGGIVLCNAKTPIARTRALAQTLADDVKAWSKGENRSDNRFDYLVLESIDYPVEPTLADFRRGRYGYAPTSRPPLAPVPGWFSGERGHVARLLTKGDLSRGQVFELARRITTQPGEALLGGNNDKGCGVPPWRADRRSPAPASPFEVQERRILQLAGKQAGDEGGGLAEGFATLAALFKVDAQDQHSRAWLWLHLAELWDYLVPERDRARTTDREGKPT